MNVDFDVLIVGGGMVGASMACALSPLPLRIGVIEAVPFRSPSQPSYDDRAIALAYGSRKILDSMGLWSVLNHRVTAIKKIHVSDRGHCGVTRIDSHSEGVPALGYVIENRVMGTVLGAALAEHNNIELICPAELTSLEFASDETRITVRQAGVATTVNAKLVIAADGGNSVVRNLLNIDTRRWDYNQTAVIANVTPSQFHDHVAYERFTDCGPVAMLPNAPTGSDDPNRCSLVWTVRRGDETRVLALSDEAFLAELQQRFGYRLGKLQKVGRRNAYPLALVRAKEHVRLRMALIGNAAHTLHPIAGQGFNLGLRDVAVLADVLAAACNNKEDIGALPVLQRYAEWRTWDHRRVIGLTDSLARLFGNPLLPVAAARNAGLLALDLLPPLKKMLTRQTMGLAGKLPRLARGLPLVEEVR